MKTLLFLILLYSSNLFGYPTSYSTSLSHALWRIYNLPEGRALIEEVESKGPISLYFAPFPTTNSALWNGSDRAIVINSNRQRSFGQLIRSVFFELHNAAADHRFCWIDECAKQGLLHKQSYIEAVERLEHQNALKTAAAIEKGIALGLFPADAKLPVLSNFNQHYNIQKQCGHSSQIAAVWDILTNSVFTNS